MQHRPELRVFRDAHALQIQVSEVYTPGDARSEHDAYTAFVIAQACVRQDEHRIDGRHSHVELKSELHAPIGARHPEHES